MYSSVINGSGSIDDIQDKKYTINHENISYYERFKHYVKKILEEKIDEEAPLPDKYKERAPWYYKALVWILASSIFIIILCYFTYIGYVSDQSTKYISLDPTTYYQDNSSPYRACFDVPNAITGTWTLDKNGYFDEFEHDYTYYYNFMIGVKSAIATVGKKSSSLTSAQNLAYLMSWAYIYDDGKYTQKVTFVGEPVYIFNRYYKTASLGSSSFPCKAIPSINLNKATGIMEVTYAYGVATKYDMVTSTCIEGGSGYISSASSLNSVTGCGNTGCCREYDTRSSFTEAFCVIPPGDFGYNSAFDSDHFVLKYNIESLMTAYAVNQNILSYDSLIEVDIGATNNRVNCFDLNDFCDNDAITGATTCSTSTYHLSFDSSTSKCSITISGKKYYMTARVDSRYPGMDPIICMIKDGTTDPTVCLLRMGNSFVYPYFNHMGTSNVDDFYSWKKGCYCKAPDIPSQFSAFYDSTMYSTNSDGYYMGQYNGYCNVFDLIHGFIIFKSNRYEDHLAYNILLAEKYTASEIDTMAYYGGFFQIRAGGNAAQNVQTGGSVTTTTTDLLTKLMQPQGVNIFSFCTGLDGTSQCSIFAMNTYDEYDSRINADGAIAPQTSCTNSHEILDSAWDSGSYNDDDLVGPTAGDGALRMPPSLLIQKYYECFNTKYSSLLTAFGSASGSAGTIQPFVMWLFVFISIKMILRKKEETNIKTEVDPRVTEIEMNINKN